MIVKCYPIAYKDSLLNQWISNPNPNPNPNVAIQTQPTFFYVHKPLINSVETKGVDFLLYYLV